MQRFNLGGRRGRQVGEGGTAARTSFPPLPRPHDDEGASTWLGKVRAPCPPTPLRTTREVGWGWWAFPPFPPHPQRRGSLAGDAAGAVLEWPDLKEDRAPAAFKCCDEEGISPGSPYIQMTPAEIPFYMQLLKIQEPCLPFQMVSLVCVCVRERERGGSCIF